MVELKKETVLKTTVDAVINDIGLRSVIFGLIDPNVKLLISKIKKQKDQYSIIIKLLKEDKSGDFTVPLDILSKNLTVDQFKDLIKNSRIEKDLKTKFNTSTAFGCLKDGYKLPSIAQIRKIAKTQKLTGKFWTDKGVNKIFIYDADSDEAYSSYGLGADTYQQLILVEDKKKKQAI
jgi:hypothetical protein